MACLTARSMSLPSRDCVSTVTITRASFSYSSTCGNDHRAAVALTKAAATFSGSSGWELKVPMACDARSARQGVGDGQDDALRRGRVNSIGQKRNFSPKLVPVFQLKDEPGLPPY